MLSREHQPVTSIGNAIRDLFKQQPVGTATWIALGRVDAAGADYLQHYFDSRGVARVYEMTFIDNVWTQERGAVAPDFSQRFTGTFDHDRDTIVGRWESSTDGSEWKPDFDLTYTRAS